MDVSVVIRTFNEQRYLDRVLGAIAGQRVDGLAVESLVVDSGSTDRTRDIARARGARVLEIEPARFSFGRSLNYGCEHAVGETLVFVSGHCIPTDESWLERLVAPIRSGEVALTYGRQVGGATSKFSECEVFAKLYPEQSAVPQEGFFCNNANAAVRRSIWEEFRFDEELLGLEDMHLAKRLVEAGRRIGYVADAGVFHHHHESWPQVRRRYEREAIALQRIRPEWHVTFTDFFAYFSAGVRRDTARALRERRGVRTYPEIVMFRLMMYWGTYRGNHEHRRLAEREKRRYFYPARF